MSKQTLKAERDYLDGVCAELEKQVARLELELSEYKSTAREFVKHELPDCMCRTKFEELLRRGE